MPKRKTPEATESARRHTLALELGKVLASSGYSKRQRAEIIGITVALGPGLDLDSILTDILSCFEPHHVVSPEIDEKAKYHKLQAVPKLLRNSGLPQPQPKATSSSSSASTGPVSITTAVAKAVFQQRDSDIVAPAKATASTTSKSSAKATAPSFCPLPKSGPTASAAITSTPPAPKIKAKPRPPPSAATSAARQLAAVSNRYGHQEGSETATRQIFSHLSQYSAGTIAVLNFIAKEIEKATESTRDHLDKYTPAFDEPEDELDHITAELINNIHFSYKGLDQ